MADVLTLVVLALGLVLVVGARRRRARTVARRDTLSTTHADRTAGLPRDVGRALPLRRSTGVRLPPVPRAKRRGRSGPERAQRSEHAQVTGARDADLRIDGRDC